MKARPLPVLYQRAGLLGFPRAPRPNRPAADQGISLDSVEKMRAALKQSKSKSEIVVYPDAPHAFFADYRPSYRQQPAEDGWKRMLDWFEAQGVE